MPGELIVIQLTLMAKAALGAGAISLALLGAVWLQSARLKSVKIEYAAFKTQVKNAGEAAAKESARATAANLKAKERADAENLRTSNALRADIKRLRDARTGSGFLPPAPAGATSPDGITLKRAELESALRRFDEGVARLLEEGDRARIDLDTARRWAQQ
ncbi:MAG: hypothetical protein DDT20_01041 [Firmicutes bacterium]|nr:hypothetical protein [Bacillota bacterium]